MGEGGGAVDCEEFVALEAEEPELDRIDRIPEFQDWGPERGRTGVSYYKLAFKPFFTCIFESCAGSPCGFIHLFYTRSAAPLRG